MNGKTLISAICLLLALCLALYFYADWQQQFDAALPVPPPADDTETGGHGKPDGDWKPDDAHDNDTGDLIPSVDWKPSTGSPHEASKPENLAEADTEDPVAKAWAQLDEIADNPFAWGGNADPRTPGLVQQLTPIVDSLESEAHAEEIGDLLNELAYLRDPRSIETLVAYQCGGKIGTAPVREALIAMGPPVVPYLLPYLDEEDDEAMGVYVAPHVLGHIGARHRVELDGIVKHIILPKLEKQLGLALTDPFPTEIRIRNLEEAIARLKR